MLSRADLQATIATLGAVVESARDFGAFADAGVRLLPGLVASEMTTLSVCDLASGRREVVACPAGRLGEADRACFDRFFSEHPLVRYHAVVHGRGAHRISDSIPFGRFRHGALYSEYYRRIGIDHAMALPLLVDDRTPGELRAEPQAGATSASATARSSTLPGRRSRRCTAAFAPVAGEGAAPPALAAALTPREREVHPVAVRRQDRPRHRRDRRLQPPHGAEAPAAHLRQARRRDAYRRGPALARQQAGAEASPRDATIARMAQRADASFAPTTGTCTCATAPRCAAVVPHTARQFGRAIIMPNLRPPVDDDRAGRSPIASASWPRCPRAARSSR